MARAVDDLKQTVIDLVLQGQSNAEIASKTGLSVDAVKQRKRRYKGDIEALKRGQNGESHAETKGSESTAETRILSSNTPDGGKKGGGVGIPSPKTPSDPSEATPVTAEVMPSNVIDIRERRASMSEKTATAARQHERAARAAAAEYTNPADAFPADLTLTQIKQRLVMNIDSPTMLTPSVVTAIRTYWNVFEYEQGLKAKDEAMTPRELDAGLQDVLQTLQQAEAIEQRIVPGKLPEA